MKELMTAEKEKISESRIVLIIDILVAFLHRRSKADPDFSSKDTI